MITNHFIISNSSCEVDRNLLIVFHLHPAHPELRIKKRKVPGSVLAPLLLSSSASLRGAPALP